MDKSVPPLTLPLELGLEVNVSAKGCVNIYDSACKEMQNKLERPVGEFPSLDGGEAKSVPSLGLALNTKCKGMCSHLQHWPREEGSAM